MYPIFHNLVSFCNHHIYVYTVQTYSGFVHLEHSSTQSFFFIRFFFFDLIEKNFRSNKTKWHQRNGENENELNDRHLYTYIWYSRKRNDMVNFYFFFDFILWQNRKGGMMEDGMEYCPILLLKSEEWSGLNWFLNVICLIVVFVVIRYWYKSDKF